MPQARELILASLLCGAAFLTAMAAVELGRQAEAVGDVAGRVDLAAGQVDDLLREARQITEQAARDAP